MTRSRDVANIIKQPFTTTLGTSNYRAGVNAGNSIASGGNQNVVVGDEAGTALTTGDQNTILGYSAGVALTTGNRNTLLGSTAGDALVGAERNTAVGYGALHTETEGDRNTAVGVFALSTQNTTGGGNIYNTAVGYAAGNAVTTGISNVLIGGLAGDALTDADQNVAVGTSALGADTLGSRSVAIGNNALATQNFTTATNSYNIAIGYSAGQQITTGTQNTIMGAFAGDALTVGFSNTAMGISALGNDTKGNKSTAMGVNTLIAQNFTTATDSFNTAVGYDAGKGITTGRYNTIMGALCCGSMQTNVEMTAVGYGLAATSQTGRAREIVIGSNGTGGGSNTARFITSQGSATLGIDGSDTSWAAASDSRLKKEIANSTVGLEFIKDLRPVTFKWNAKNAIADSLPQYVANSSDPVYGEGKAHHGFIAQEVKAVIDSHSDVVDGHNLWSQDFDGTQQIAPSALIPMLTKAVQELSTALDAALARITTLEG